MKIIILHGEDVEKVYPRLKKFIDTAKKRSWEVNYLEGEDLNFRENLTSISLFGNARFFILNGIQKLSKKELDWLFLNFGQLLGTLIIYNEGQISGALLKRFPKDFKVEEFKLPKVIWTFLEGLFPGNAKNCIKRLHQSIESSRQEQVFALVGRQFKNLYLVKTGQASTLPAWQTQKLKGQADKFSENEIRQNIELLSDIDFKSKTGGGDLTALLDLWLVTNLK